MSGGRKKTKEYIRGVPWDSLTDKQQAFCLEYVKRFNAKEAARAAGYKGINAPAKLMNNVKVKRWIGAFRRKLVDGTNVDVEQLVKEINYGLTRSVKDYLDDDGIIHGNLNDMSDEAARQVEGIEQEVTERLDKDGNPVSRTVKSKFKLVSKATTMRLAAEVTGLTAKDQEEKTLSINWDDMRGRDDDEEDPIEEELRLLEEQ